MPFWRRPKDIERLISKHLELVDEALAKFRETLVTYLDEEDRDRANELALEAHKLEGRADDVRREVEAELLRGALLASSRGDILEIIERTDKLANAGEATLDFLLLQRIRIPEVLKPLTKEITDKSLEIFNDVKKALHRLFQDRDKALEYTKAIEHGEGEVDELERDFIKRLFEMDIELAEKILVRGFLERLTEISDRAEDLSDRIEMAVAQRKV
jgi:predicted phosphate transport protein (TIGR00153 family)